MFVGPVFGRELATTPRRPRHYASRVVYVGALFILICTAWLVVAGAQVVRNVGDMARFGAILFQILAPLQLALFTFLAAISAASSVAQEKDRRTLVLLLMTRLTNSELVLGKLLASQLTVVTMMLTATPVFALTTLFGGISYLQVVIVFVVTLLTTMTASSVGSTIALWRDKTFQTLSMTCLSILMWIGLCEAVHQGVFGRVWLGLPTTVWAAGFSPLHAVMTVARPSFAIELSVLANGAWIFIASSLGMIVLLNGIAMWRIRVWNPTREVRPGQEDETDTGSEALFSTSTEQSPIELKGAEAARSQHIDARIRSASQTSRAVWDNPVLWREICTWAYGRKVVIIRVAYLFLFVMTWIALHLLIDSGSALQQSRRGVVPAAVQPLAPFFLVSLVIVNALAVTSVTNERDGLSLDLLLVTDLTPVEFVFGKLGGVFWITKEMVLLPMFLCLVLWWGGGITTENVVYVIGGLAVMNIFVTMLGMHCGMTYANSRSAVTISLGIVFFLFLGVVTCIVMMISFSGSFHTQLPPFLAFILGGSVGLFVALGSRNPSNAMGWSSLLLPFATFYAITSFLLNYTLPVFLVTAIMYGFTTAAMLIPAVSEFDIAMGRTRLVEEE